MGRVILLVLLLLTGCGTSPDVSGDTFEEDLRLAQEQTEAFWTQQFSALGRAYRPVRGFIAYSGDGGPACGGQPSVPDNAFYCSDGHFIAYDKGWLKGLYEELGDGSVYVIIPHELGHAVQQQLGTAFELNVQRELQADCYAGGALGGLVSAKVLQPEAGDDTELLVNLAAAGDPSQDWFNPQAHGTARERQNAFTTGYRDGVGGC
ncbi:neutral zinc metallopeptidase [Nonomuraea sp. NPDC050556]|uniref:neutral zinc metallopeptidase n=1 Tax=Nonomuraea sp. NPDC050556 TaxID=3364369 RepID=UPI0037B3D9D2